MIQIPSGFFVSFYQKVLQESVDHQETLVLTSQMEGLHEFVNRPYPHHVLPAFFYAITLWRSRIWLLDRLNLQSGSRSYSATREAFHFLCPCSVWNFIVLSAGLSRSSLVVLHTNSRWTFPTAKFYHRYRKSLYCLDFVYSFLASSEVNCLFHNSEALSDKDGSVQAPITSRITSYLICLHVCFSVHIYQEF